MKPYFAKYLPVEGEVKEGDLALSIDNTLHIYHDSYDEKDEWKKVKLFLCSRDIQVGDKVYPFLHGHMDDVEQSPFHPKVEWDYERYCSGWPNEPHIILNLNYSDYKPYRISTDYGYGSPGRYIKVIGEISPDATWVKEGDEFGEDEVGVLFNFVGEGYDDEFFTLAEWPKAVRKWLKKDSLIRKQLINHPTIAIKGPCGHFH